MKAQVGDRLIPGESSSRTGLIIGLREADGSPPYVVKWLDTGHIALVFPGPYARLLPGHQQTDRPAPAAGGPAGTAGHVRA
ncbi:MAG TPA: DUF1918 domain-containing protein [Streptosporangiaceae bacterium]|nr:DUF1918 domain-containing protein [Streptosporangiaceae bacterium]